MYDEQPQPEDYIRVPRLRMVRKTLVDLLVMRAARILTTAQGRTIVDITESMASRGRSGWVSTRNCDGDQWTVVLDPDFVATRSAVSVAAEQGESVHELPSS